MTKIIVAIPKIEDAGRIRDLLVRNGFEVAAVCSSGAQALNQMDNLKNGIVISSYRLPDMLYTELRDFLPPGFEMLLLASQSLLMECSGSNLMCLGMPLKVHDLLNTVEMMTNSIMNKQRKGKAKPGKRRPEEVALINEAKCLLMSRNNMTEEEAHRYIQKYSMDSCTNMVETAQMILAVMKS